VEFETTPEVNEMICAANAGSILSGLYFFSHDGNRNRNETRRKLETRRFPLDKFDLIKTG